MTKPLTRRSFVQWGTAAAGAAALVGLTACSEASEPESPELSDTGNQGSSSAVSSEPTVPAGEWKTGGCLYNCSCGSSRCLVKVYVEDGIPLRVASDYEDVDSVETMQRRACPRGYGQVSRVLSPARIKHPMKRVGWSPEEPNGQLRGRDEWEKISWEEALDIVATQTKKTIDEYGPRSILISGWNSVGGSVHLFDPAASVFNALGGGMYPGFGTVSLGCWACPSVFMTGTWASAPDMLSQLHSKIHLLFGCNWAANKAGNVTYLLSLAKEQGAKIIVVDPWLNQTAQAVATQWIPIKPGTDTALMLAMMQHMVANNLYDQEYLDKYTVGFDAQHMPEGAPAEGNFKDYVMGTYDDTPKTPEWAAPLCGVPAETIKALAEEIAAEPKVNFFCGQSVSKIPAGEMVAQAFYTMALMHGGIGSDGCYMSWIGHNEHNYSSVRYSAPGANVDPLGINAKSPLALAKVAVVTPIFPGLEDTESWEHLDYTECWQSILDGEYGRDCWPGGKRKLDVHMIYSGARGNYINQLPNANAGVQVFRKMDFVVGSGPFFDPSVQYADIVLPVCHDYEIGNIAWQYNSDATFWMDKICEPVGEAKPMTWVAEQLAERLDLNPSEIITPDAVRGYYSIKDASVLVDVKTMEREPMLSITQSDLDELGFEGQPQQGRIPFAEFRAKGVYKPQRAQNDSLMYYPYKDFYEDPEGSPLATSTGKFEIYCPTLAGIVNAIGYSTIAPIAKWQTDPTQGEGSQTDEYPLLLWTPHSLRRGHSVNDDVASLREAFPQECFMSVVDAQARGIKTGDPVLMTSPYGKVLRPAKVLPTIAPGAVALQEGAWMLFDEETGIDIAGNPNVLQAPAATGEGSQSWTGTLVQVEKYTGPISLQPDKLRPALDPDSLL